MPVFYTWLFLGCSFSKAYNKQYHVAIVVLCFGLGRYWDGVFVMVDGTKAADDRPYLMQAA